MLKQTDLPDTPELILQRLDRIVAELQLLRQAVVTIQEHSKELPDEHIVKQLYGALGQGTKGEYDTLLD